jgi:hypothetical protein
MKYIAFFLVVATLILSPFTMASSSIHNEDSIAELKAQMAQLSKRLDNMDTYTATLGKSKKKLAWAEKIKIKGDMRYRYETIEDDRKLAAAGADDRNRSRIRARLGVTAQVLMVETPCLLTQLLMEVTQIRVLYLTKVIFLGNFMTI